MKKKFKTINDFKEVAVNSYKELVVGAKFFEDNYTIEILSEVYRDPRNNFLWVDVKATTEDGYEVIRSESLADHNITNGGYNPWMWFKDPEIAKEFSERDWVIGEEEGIFDEPWLIHDKPSWCETLTKEEIEKFPVRETITFR